jgi:predicted small secreted protein
MSNLPHNPPIVHDYLDRLIHFAVGFGLATALSMLALWLAGCNTARGLARDISIVTATMAADPQQANPLPDVPIAKSRQ